MRITEFPIPENVSVSLATAASRAATGDAAPMAIRSIRGPQAAEGANATELTEGAEAAATMLGAGTHRGVRRG
jgi:hypothetical protein